MKYKNIVQVVGHTPLIELPRKEGAGRVFAKIESRNPGGSVKDRAALYMIRDAQEKGLLKEGDTIVEATSGNTGIALSMIGRALGLNVVIVMPGSMSEERKQLMRAYGAELILTGEGGMQAAVDKANELVEEKGYFLVSQFENPANALAHYETTGPEIYKDLPEVTAFVAGIGTGGTVTGVGRFLKEKNPEIKVFGIEPKDSPLLTEGKAGGHKIQGIGANFVPGVLDQEILDKVYTIATEEAFQGARELSKNAGVLAGISSGSNAYMAYKIAEELGEDSVVVTVLPDTGERYLSTELFAE
ncbi:cysteine synthase A [Peptoniphilus sp. KCTC 25270]|uniref:cysteine synthase A n=1 Tax=Peptoniphilus sp. KCTC 25270 TaxID=2897414 RepID=UPI001E6035CD|nr:cysteine synthase A [Peptoniphilus sp. KCTC 25270]MCD1147727.1 cysteine synthase A [Peptoniphilus sp. KCTC 25270]